MASVSLREVTADTVRAICALDVAPRQLGLVAPNAVSIAQAHFEPAAWFRAIYADDEPVGFAMLYDPTRTAEPEAGPGVAFLWRFMIDARYQGRGYGAAALALLVAHVRTLPGVAVLRISYVDVAGQRVAAVPSCGLRPDRRARRGRDRPRAALVGNDRCESRFLSRCASTASAARCATSCSGCPVAGSRLGRGRRDAGDHARVGLPAGRPRLPRLPASRRRSEEYALARTERKTGRGLPRLRRSSPRPRSRWRTTSRDATSRSTPWRATTTARSIDPFGGARDLRAGVLRHVSPAFAEDPVRVLRVARFAARFGFRVAPETMDLMRAMVASGEVADARARARLAGAREGALPRRSRRAWSRSCASAARLPCCCRRWMRCSAFRSRRATTRRSTRACT